MISFRAFEVLFTMVMVGTVLAVGPAIRRFGDTYEREAFGSTPETSAEVLNLLDIAYYLIFGAYIVITLQFVPDHVFEEALTGWLRQQLIRTGGLLLLMGILHVALLVSMPVAGLVLRANHRRTRIAQGHMSHDAGLEPIDRGITIAVWMAAGLIAIQLLGTVLILVLGLSG